MLETFTQVFSRLRYAAVLLMLPLFFMQLCGCSLFRGPSGPIIGPVPKKTGDLRGDLLARAESIKGLDIRGRLCMTNRGRKLPSFNVHIWFFSQGQDLHLRIRGSGPLGITVFDLLADRNEAWIYLPSKGRIFKGNTFFTSYGNIDVETAIRLMEICLNPWVPACYCRFPGTLEPLEKGKNLVKLNCRFLARNIVASYQQTSLMPVNFRSSLADITFESKASNSYPEKISFNLKRDGIKGTLIVKDVKFNTLSTNSPVFNRSIFLK